MSEITVHSCIYSARKKVPSSCPGQDDLTISWVMFHSQLSDWQEPRQVICQLNKKTKICSKQAGILKPWFTCTSKTGLYPKALQRFTENATVPDYGTWQNDLSLVHVPGWLILSRSFTDRAVTTPPMCLKKPAGNFVMVKNGNSWKM